MTAQKRKKPASTAKAPVKAARMPLLLRRSFWKRFGAGFFAFLFLFIASHYAISVWYGNKYKHEPWVLGTTFIAPYAEYYGLDPKETLQALTDDMGFTHFRLVSYWSRIEANQGTYDYSELDWQFKMIEQAGGKISLAIGLRQPRWPECHMPQWAQGTPMTQWEPQLIKFIEATMKRYKDSPALESYQLENEFYLAAFGECTDFSQDRLIREFNAAKSFDPDHKIIITRSNNVIGYPVSQPRADEYGASIYKRVWDKTITKRYFEYPFPSWFYGTLAGGGEILTGKKLFIHELQTEAWLPEGDYEMNRIDSIPEQNKSMDAERLTERVEFAKKTNIKTIYTWGAEWWYWRKTKANDPSLWNAAKEQVRIVEEQNARDGNSYQP